MGRSAIIIAEKEDQRRKIAQRISPLDLFDQVHFCGTLQEVRSLLENVQIQIIFCETGPTENETLMATAELASLANEGNCRLVFFSSSNSDEPLIRGIVPLGSHCVNYQVSCDDLQILLQTLLKQTIDSAPSKHSSFSKIPLSNNPEIYSRFYFDNFLNQELSRSKLTGRLFSLLLIEPKLLISKQNRTQNLAPLLPTIALAIKAQIRTSDLLCRFEQQRLALLLPETSIGDAEQVITRIQNKISELTTEVPLKLKIGLASPGLSNQYSSYGLLREAATVL